MEKEDTFYFGVHFMVDGYEAPPEVLRDRESLEIALREIPIKMGMYTISKPIIVEVGPNNKKDPGGISGVVLIAESHLSFHTFPKRGFVTIDMYTCMDKLDTDTLLSELKNIFQFVSQETHYIKRGRGYPHKDIHT